MPKCDYCDKEAINALKYRGETYLVCAKDFGKPMLAATVTVPGHPELVYNRDRPGVGELHGTT